MSVSSAFLVNRTNSAKWKIPPGGASVAFENVAEAVKIGPWARFSAVQVVG